MILLNDQSNDILVDLDQISGSDTVERVKNLLLSVTFDVVDYAS